MPLQVEAAMTSLMIVPDDILLKLLTQSGSIDDSLRLGMCCRRLYGLLDRYRLGIMRCIIVIPTFTYTTRNVARYVFRSTSSSTEPNSQGHTVYILLTI